MLTMALIFADCKQKVSQSFTIKGLIAEDAAEEALTGRHDVLNVDK